MCTSVARDAATVPRPPKVIGKSRFVVKRSEKTPTLDEIELRPDGWERFERAVDAAVKVGPKPRVPKNRAEGTEPAKSG